MDTKRFGSDPYDSASANGWFVMEGDVAVAGPFCDKRIADRRMDEILSLRARPDGVGSSRSGRATGT